MNQTDSQSESQNQIDYFNNIRIFRLNKTPRNVLNDFDIFSLNFQIKEYSIENQNPNHIPVDFWNCTYTNSKSRQLHFKLQELKNRIEPFHHDNRWDEYKKICNPFEYVYSPTNQPVKSISKYHPISRSFFKLWEILCDFEIDNYASPKRTSWKIANLAEGPGGFMDCINYYRKCNRDISYGITLPPTHDDIPSWKKIEKKKRRIFNFQNIHIYYGNLYYPSELNEYRHLFRDGKADFITADGGFDYSTDFNHQEQQSFRMIFAEIVMALSIQKMNGNFVIKVFDILTEFTQKLLYILTIYYEDVYIVKPYTSRSANSEKYVYCSNFRGISESKIREWNELLNNWNYIVNHPTNNHSINEIINITGLQLPESFITHMENYNEQYIEQQIIYIQNILELLESNKSINYYFYHQQIINAIWWCNKYNMKMNSIWSGGYVPH
jgi:23S rRNA U2552 (ribose-2'-O)-methylase RlmE/FtsJ